MASGAITRDFTKKGSGSGSKAQFTPKGKGMFPGGSGSSSELNPTSAGAMTLTPGKGDGKQPVDAATKKSRGPWLSGTAGGAVTRTYQKGDGKGPGKMAAGKAKFAPTEMPKCS
jgi:hypothetical protein